MTVAEVVTRAFDDVAGADVAALDVGVDPTVDDVDADGVDVPITAVDEGRLTAVVVLDAGPSVVVTELLVVAVMPVAFDVHPASSTAATATTQNCPLRHTADTLHHRPFDAGFISCTSHPSATADGQGPVSAHRCTICPMVLYRK